MNDKAEQSSGPLCKDVKRGPTEVPTDQPVFMGHDEGPLSAGHDMTVSDNEGLIDYFQNPPPLSMPVPDWLMAEVSEVAPDARDNHIAMRVNEASIFVAQLKDIYRRPVIRDMAMARRMVALDLWHLDRLSPSATKEIVIGGALWLASVLNVSPPAPSYMALLLEEVLKYSRHAIVQGYKDVAKTYHYPNFPTPAIILEAIAKRSCDHEADILRNRAACVWQYLEDVSSGKKKMEGRSAGGISRF